MARRAVTYFTNAERSKIYHAKKIRSSVNPLSVPKIKAKRSVREALIDRYILQLDKSIYCPAIGDNVAIIRRGKKETIYRAGAKHKSTISALTLKEAIENATYIKNLPIKNSSRNQKLFKLMHLLICPIRGIGYAKLLIGELKDIYVNIIGEQYAHYCITQISLKELKK